MWNFTEYKDNVAFLDEYGSKVKYSDLSNTAKSLSTLMPKRALSFILCKNTLGSTVSYVSNFLNHQVSLLVKSDLDTELLQNLIEKYQPQYIFAPSDDIESFGITALSIKDCEKLDNIYDYSLLKTNFNCDYEIYDELALLLTTSGSTGSPKFVRQSFHNVESNTVAIAKYLKLDSTERPITVLPMYYTFGLSVINSHLEVGATILLTDKSIMQKEFWTFLKDKQATSISGVPYTYQMLNMLRFTRMDLPYLKTLTQAGGHLNEKLQKLYADYCKDNGKEFYVMYGQCEATARMSYLEPEFSDTKIGSIGKELDGCKFEIIDEQGNVVKEPNKEGELVFVGPNVTLGYADSCDDLSKSDEREGRLNTGDIGYFDEDGFYFITGRKKRFLKIFGNRVNLEDVDKLIFEKFNNLEFATYGIDDHLYIFIAERDKEKQDEVFDYVVDKLKLHPSAFKVVVLDKIPRNESGKVLYKELALH
ncbi:MAG: AMP-binding protein [Succinatimonas sp.]|nr:AMP-binding protein [Succinatimonas sp.]